MGEPVRASGAVPWRLDADRAVEVLLVHRPRYGDWTFPKGKLERGESDEECARREVEEETGLRGPLGAELPPCEYVDNRGRPKVVRYWVLRVDGGEFVPNDEVDEVMWLGVSAARVQLSYPRDGAVLDAFERVWEPE